MRRSHMRWRLSRRPTHGHGSPMAVMSYTELKTALVRQVGLVPLGAAAQLDAGTEEHGGPASTGPQPARPGWRRPAAEPTAGSRCGKDGLVGSLISLTVPRADWPVPIRVPIEQPEVPPVTLGLGANR